MVSQEIQVSDYLIATRDNNQSSKHNYNITVRKRLATLFVFDITLLNRIWKDKYNSGLIAVEIQNEFSVRGK